MDDAIGNGGNCPESDAVSEPDPNMTATAILEVNSATSAQTVTRRRMRDSRMQLWLIILLSGMSAINRNGSQRVLHEQP